MACAAAKRLTPEDLLYVLHARLDVPPDAQGSTIGVITHGGFVRCDDAETTLPEDYASRYARRVW